MTDAERRRWAQLLRVVAVAGAFVAISGVLVGWRLAGRLQTGVDDSLALAEDSLATTDETIGVLAGVLTDVDGTIATVEQSVVLTASTVRSSAGALDGAAAATPAIVASLVSMRTSVERVAEVVGSVEGSLSAIGRLPGVPDYAPSQSLAGSVLALRPDLDALVAGLNRLDSGLQQMDRDVTPLVVNLDALRADLAELRSGVGRSEALLGEYRATTARVRVLASTTRADLGRDLTETRVVIVLAGLVFLAGQVVPLALARLLTSVLDEPGATPPDS